MLSVSRRMLTMIILVVVIQYIAGKQKIVHVSDNEFFTSGEDSSSHTCCVYGNCSCNSLDQALANLTSNILINITANVTLSSLVRASHLENVSIIGHHGSTVNCDRNAAGIHFIFCHDCYIQNIVWNGCGIENNSALKLNKSSNVIIQDCTFHSSMGQAVVLSEVFEVSIKNCNFVNNNYYRDHGAIIYYAASQCFQQRLLTIIDSNFSYNEGAKSLVYIENRIFECDGFNVTFHHSNFCYNHGTSIYVVNGRLYFTGRNSFQYNTAEKAAGIYISDHSTVVFSENSNATFIRNTAGAGVLLRNYSSIIFDQDSLIKFKDNTANGTVYAEDNSNVTFKANSQVIFNSGNSGMRSNAIIFSSYNSHVKFMENSNVTFDNHIFATAIENGCILCSANYSYITIGGNSTIVFSRIGGILISVITLLNHSHISFKESSTTVFKDNKLNAGGSGVIWLNLNSTISFKENSITFFINSTSYGGAISLFHGHVSFEDASTTVFRSNSGEHGGALFIYNSSLLFKGNSNTSFISNTADNGGALFCISCIAFLQGSSTISFAYNEAIQDGGVMHFAHNSKVLFSEFTKVNFNNNNAVNGGALFANDSSAIYFEGHALVTFTNNIAVRSGGAAYFNMHCIATWTQNATVIFENNSAVFGGAVCLHKNTSVLCENNSIILFKNNMAISEGGAVSTLTNSSVTVKDSTMITFTANNAIYGGAIFFGRPYTTLTFNSNKTDVNQMKFTRNTAGIAGNDLYFDLIKSVKDCLNNRTFGVVNETKHYIVTPPSNLKFEYPAECISYDNKAEECNKYYLKRLMLGEEIYIPVCLLDYCNEPSYSTQRFTIHDTSDHNYVISDHTEFLLSCQSDALQDIRILGNALTKSFNYSFNVILNIYGNVNWKQISVNLTIQLTPCYPGFWQYPESQKCECYKAGDILLCSGSNSTIKRGYWFGNVSGKPTVSVCPINYCNFTCCDTSNGYYELSPVRDNQCRSHRSGAACGSCADGYTLSFDSTECISTNNCTTEKTILVIFLTMIYWIVMVALVFTMMYYKIEIGYLYGITYFYSIVDILLNQNLQTSRGLYIIVSIMSSFSKIIPQFLGELCLTTGMSGIDQQFIHYVHPLAIIVILVIISVLATKSRRISTIISRGIIHVICLLLLLSYTSIASTSLLLMGLLQFHEIDGVYTYLSPDIKYFHGRHLAYAIMALLCTVSIVIGLPLLLIFEPILNQKFNFIKVKPLLDQFQGCYKDKYRCFAGYYMICRLFIITFFIINSFSEFITNYLLNAVCLVIASIHLVIKPYNHTILNNLDGAILQIIVLFTALPLLDDDFNSPIIIPLAFMIIILPLIIFIAMTLYLHKDYLKKLVVHFISKNTPPNSNDVIQNEIPLRNFDLIIDDSTRQNATICDISHNDSDDQDCNSYQESLYEVMNDFKD